MSLYFRYMKIKIEQLGLAERGRDECNDLIIKLSDNNDIDINYQIISTEKNVFKLHDEIILDMGQMNDVSSLLIKSTANSYGSSAVSKVTIFIAEKLDEWSMLYKDLTIDHSGDYTVKYSKKIKIDAEYFVKHFLLQQINTNHIFSINNNKMVDLDQQVINKQLYLEKGFNNVRDINNLKNINLNDFKLMMYIDTNIDVKKVNLACQVEPYKPIDRLKSTNDGIFDILVKELDN